MLGFMRSGLQTNDALSASPFIAIALVAFCVLLIPDRCAREPFKPSERRSRMRRGSLPRGSAHRLYRSRLPNDFSNLRHHRFRSGSMGNGGERRTSKPKNACGSRVCTPVRCVRSSPGRINRSKHARPFQCRRERNSGRLARRHLRIFHGRAVLGTRFDGSICPNRKGINRTRNRQSGFRARRNRNAHWHGKRYMRPQRERGRSRTLGPLRMQNFARSLLRPAKHKRAQLRIWNSMPYATTARSAHSKLSRTHANLPRAKSKCLGSCHSAGISQP